MRLLVSALCAVLVGSMFSVVAGVGSAVGAEASHRGPCTDFSPHFKATRGRAHRVHRFLPDAPRYNGTRNLHHFSVTTTATRTHRTTHTVEIGAEGGMSLGPYSAKISAKYGYQAEKTISRGRSVTDSIAIRPRHSGWLEWGIYRRRHTVTKWHWNSNCHRVIDGRVTWRRVTGLVESRTRRGRVYF
jgi:hypothetical protein